MPDTAGCEINSLVRPLAGEEVIITNYPSSFQNTKLDIMLEKAGVGELVIVGAMSHMCVDITVRAAFERGDSSTVICDACATCDLNYAGNVIPAAEVHGVFMTALGQAFATVITAEEYLRR